MKHTFSRLDMQYTGPNAQIQIILEKLEPGFVTYLPESVVTDTKAYGNYTRKWRSNLLLATVLKYLPVLW